MRRVETEMLYFPGSAKKYGGSREGAPFYSSDAQWWVFRCLRKLSGFDSCHWSHFFRCTRQEYALSGKPLTEWKDLLKRYLRGPSADWCSTVLLRQGWKVRFLHGSP